MRCIWLLCLSFSLCAQTVDISNLGTGTVSLAGYWKFHPGDNPRWADPQFDDSGSKLVKVPMNLNQQGYPNFSGYGWYRLTLHCDPSATTPDLRLAVLGVANVGAFFANGIQFGQFGQFPPKVRLLLRRPISFPISSARWQDDRLLLAVRIWADPQIASGGFVYDSLAGLHAPAIGSPLAIQNLVDARKRGLELDRLPELLATYAGLILAFYLLGLYFMESHRPEYLWLGLCFIGATLKVAIRWIAQDTFMLPANLFRFLNDLMVPLVLASLIFGVWAAFNTRVGQPLKVFIWFFLIYQLIASGAIYSGLLATQQKYGFLEVIVTPFMICTILAFLLYNAWTHSGELRWFALSFVPRAVVDLIHLATIFIPSVRKHVDLNLVELLFGTADIFTVVAIGFILIRRSGRFKAEGDRLHAEMKAAQQVQKLMLPAQFVNAPHLHIDTAYLPSQEVGGDFYQIATGDDGSILLIIGDVSGKGLQAALTMSLIVGLWQEVVCTTQSPRNILCRFNSYLQSRMSGGFVTCLCARLQPGGQLTIANAGHLAPYLNGAELAISNGLPLGITEESEYEESRHLLSPTDTLVLISDGVVEARDKRRSLYGLSGYSKRWQNIPERKRLPAALNSSARRMTSR